MPILSLNRVMTKKKNGKTLKKHNARTRQRQKSAERKYTGVFHGSQLGFGFITADAEYGDRFNADLFVPARFVKDAVTGDRVKFTLHAFDGAAEAHVSDVISRGTVTFTGTYRYIKRREGNRLTVSHVVIADDKKLCFDTLIPPKHLSDAHDGDKVLCEITTYPDTANRIPARGIILRSYGPSDRLGPNVEALLDASEIRTVFPAPVTEQADALSRRRVLSRGRLDLRGEKIFTIDGADFKDMDDAISVKRTEDCFELGVHIADVSEYVTHNGILDEEAYLRGTSVYFADRVIPMLPPSLSNGICSLNPHVNRYALSAFLEIDRHGNIKSCRVAETVIRSAVRGVYSEVNDVLEKGNESKFHKKYAPVFDAGGLDDINALYNALCEKSRKRHAMQLDSPEVGFVTDGEGNVVDAFIRERGTAERMIEQFMLAANEGVASLLKDSGLPCVYRVHGKPDPEKLRSLSAFARVIGVDPSAIEHDDVTLYNVEKFLDEAKKKGKGEILSYMTLRCMMKARYERELSPHFGLGADCYCHFTSPIRRYPDLVVHRIIKTLLLHKKTEYGRGLFSYAEKAALRSNECEDRAVKLERDMDDLYMADLMKDRVGEEYDAVISGVTQYGFYARTGFGAEGFVRVGAVGTEYIQALSTLTVKSRPYRPGDCVRVRVAGADLSQRRIDFDLITDNGRQIL